MQKWASAYHNFCLFKSTITFDNNTGRWIHKAIDKQGKLVLVERYVDDKDQQQVVSLCDKPSHLLLLLIFTVVILSELGM